MTTAMPRTVIPAPAATRGDSSMGRTERLPRPATDP